MFLFFVLLVCVLFNYQLDFGKFQEIVMAPQRACVRASEHAYVRARVYIRVRACMRED